MQGEEQGKRPISSPTTSEPKRSKVTSKDQTQDRQPQPSLSIEELISEYKTRLSEAFIKGDLKEMMVPLYKLNRLNYEYTSQGYLLIANRCSDIEKLYIRGDFLKAGKKTDFLLKTSDQNIPLKIQNLIKELKQRLSLFLIKELSEIINSNHSYDYKCDVIKKIVAAVKKLGISEDIEKINDALNGYIQLISETFENQKKGVEVIIETLKQDLGKETLPSKMSASSNSDVMDLETSDYTAVSALLAIGADLNVSASADASI